MAAFTAALADHKRLQDRIGHSKEILAQVRAELAKYAADRRGDICVFVAGSLGRFETGRISDLDVFFLRDGDRDPGRRITRLLEIETISDVMKVNEALGLAPFSGDGRYLKIHEVGDLIATTGDARDDSENLFTARMLLLLESQPLSNDEVYNSAIHVC